MARYQSGFALALLAAYIGQSATLKIVGAPYAIADITPSAGWVVLECDQHSLAQDVRLVCSSENEEAAGCSHFFLGDGPTHKYVRLPESCAPFPFGRIADFRVDEDQTIPEHAASKIERRDGMAPRVFSIRVDDQFEHVDSLKYGKVYAAAVGVSIPGVDTNFAIPENIGMKEVADNWVAQAIEDTGVKVIGLKATFTHYVTKPNGLLDPKADPKKEKVVPEAKSGAIEWGSKTEPFNINFKPEKGPKCDNGSLQVKMDATLATKVYGTASYFGSAGVADLQEKSLIALLSNIAGWLYSFQFSANVEHDLTATVTLEGTVNKDFTILEPKPIPKAGIDLKIFKAGLMFGIDGEIHLTAKVGVEVKTGFKWGIEKIGISIPPSMKGKPWAKDGYFDVGIARDDSGQSATSEIAMSATPKLSIGIESSKVNLKLKAWVGFKAGLALVVGLTGKKKRSSDAVSDWYCAKLKAQFEASVGAEGKLFNLFSLPDFDKSFWDKELDLWEHGNCPEPKSKRSVMPGPLQSRTVDGTISQKLKETFNCPKKDAKVEKADAKKGMSESRYLSRLFFTPNVRELIFLSNSMKVKDRKK
ncbi:hypothetical protein ONZ45_g14478 [Pleurotus djamor]|nr:hypothetical protein ONZ45_g14478 [Pleurotus djamor]